MTSLTLISRLQADPQDERAWSEFVDRYGNRIRAWCRGWGLQQHDADDVVQNVLLAVSRQMPGFEYRPSGRFRAWLKTISYRAWLRFIEKKKRQASPQESDHLEDLFSDRAQEDFLTCIQRECDRDLLEVAMANVRPRVKELTWRTFSAVTAEDRSPEEVARQLGIKRAAVYVAKCRIQKMLLEEINRLDEELGG